MNRWLAFVLVVAAVFVVLSFFSLEGCVSMNPVPDDPKVVVVDEQADCAEACANMEALNYPGWDGSPGPDRQLGTEDDQTCTQVCVEVETTGDGFSWNTPCIASSMSIDDIDACSEEP